MRVSGKRSVELRVVFLSIVRRSSEAGTVSVRVSEREDGVGRAKKKAPDNL